MKKRLIIFVWLAFLLTSCALHSHNNSGTISQSPADDSTQVTNDKRLRYIVYDPYSTANFKDSVVQVDYLITEVSEQEKSVLTNTSIGGCIALVSLVEIDFDDAEEISQSGEFVETFCSTPVLVRIEKILLENKKNKLNVGETVEFTVHDRWTKDTDGNYTIEYYYSSIPLTEIGEKYIIRILQPENCFSGRVLSFPINPDGSYTESILEYKDSDCFRKEQWSFSDEVLKRYDITE